MNCQYGECERCGHNSNGFCTFHQFTIGYHEKETIKYSVDPFQIAKLFKEKEEKTRRDRIPELNDCPYCELHALFYDRIHDVFECLNVKCKTYKRQSMFECKEYKEIIIYINKIN